jgi:hypothetical protein
MMTKVIECDLEQLRFEIIKLFINFTELLVLQQTVQDDNLKKMLERQQSTISAVSSNPEKT